MRLYLYAKLSGVRLVSRSEKDDSRDKGNSDGSGLLTSSLFILESLVARSFAASLEAAAFGIQFAEWW